MTHDDDFVDHLQDMARTTPAVRVDRQQVLRAGRRRRIARRSGVAVLAVAAVATSAAGVQALLPTSDGSTPVAGRTSTPSPAPDPEESTGVVFDPSTGTVVEPLDAWFWTPQEQAIQAAALEHFRSTCLAEAGVPGYQGVAEQVAVPVIPDDGFATYGLWEESQLDGLGYTPRPDPGAVAPRSAYTGAATDGSDLDQALACVAEADDAGLVFDGNEIEDQGPAGTTPVDDTDEGRDVIAAWGECVRRDGVEAPTDPEAFAGLVPAVPDDATQDERARIAEVDLGCKDQLGSVDALADLVAENQDDYITRAQGYLTEVRAAQEPVVTAAVAYLQDHGIAVPPRDRAAG